MQGFEIHFIEHRNYLKALGKHGINVKNKLYGKCLQMLNAYTLIQQFHFYFYKYSHFENNLSTVFFAVLFVVTEHWK